MAIRIQKMIGDEKIKSWETVLHCREDCLEYTLWVLRKRNPDYEYRIHPMDVTEKELQKVDD